MKLVKTIAKIVVFVGVWAAAFYAASYFAVPWLEYRDAAPATVEVCRGALALLIAAVIACLAILIFDGRKGFPKLVKRPLRDALLGLFAGAFWVGVTFLLFTITDSIFPAGTSWPDFVSLWALAVLLNVLTQELILRGFVYTAVARNYGAAAAIAVSSLVSLLAQGDAFENGAVAVIFAVSAAALYGVMRQYTGGLLAPVITHLIWNLVGGLAFGLVDLGGQFPKIFQEDISGEDIISGGSAGFEGSVLSIIVCILLIDFVILLGDGAKSREDD
ncbi:MAG: CPBP family intramembrane metalloprotease [Clostridiales Family XIII bacterium]|jgi:membrane protease YdiL (CAAX protease family)|nr:CPBP family intramembrane metalloprotease [Clostridiales Family XIII bacterium]